MVNRWSVQLVHAVCLFVAVSLMTNASWSQDVATPAEQVAEEPAATEEKATRTPDDKARDFIRYFEMHVRPLETEANLAWWEANVTGDDAAFEKKREAENRLNETLASEYRFKQINAIRKQEIEDPVLARQIKLLYLKYLPKQIDTELLRRMTDKANTIEQTFNQFRAKLDDQYLSDSQVRRILKESQDSDERRQAWEASKVIGEQLEADIKELVWLRNEAAKSLGFDNFHDMQLQLNEQSTETVLKLFDGLDALTRQPFAQAKADIDARLAANYGIPPGQLRPWHYHDPFFQEAPGLERVDADAIFANVDIPKVCAKFYAGIGLPVQEVLDASDLFERPGKSPHAFCIDINREGDVRVLANIVPNEYWMTTMLHELGHAVYSSKFIPDSLPYTLRTDAHILATEGVAMMFERFSGSSEWLAAMGITVPDPQAYDAAAHRNRRNKLLIFSRWCQVMFRFEMEMYRDPAQDLNKLWWDLVERYQLMKRPEGRDAPDYATKVHIVTAPAYYHNYMMGELFACQLHASIASEVLDIRDPRRAVYFDNKDVGRFLRRRVFQEGAKMPWYELTRHATGADLTAQAFAQEFGR